MDKMFSKNVKMLSRGITITCFRCHSKKVKNGRARVQAGRKSLTEEYSNEKTPEEKRKAIICT